MNPSSLQKTGMSPKAMLAAASISLLAMAPSAEAVVTWQVSEVGGHVHATTTGSLSLSNTPVNLLSQDTGSWSTWSPEGYRLWGNVGNNAGAFIFGINNGNSGLLAPIESIRLSGGNFGNQPFASFDEGVLMFDTADIVGGFLVPVVELDFGAGTIASLFGSNLDSGPLTMWTNLANGDTIQIAAVPEPTTLLVLPSLAFACLVRNRRRK